MLDAQEYLHLAIKASESKDHFAALSYLHKSIELEPTSAHSYFLLAAQHAELGMFDRAIAEMKTALDLDPALNIAKFQLSLLLIQADAEDEAEQYLREIIYADNDEPLTHFANGMSALIQKLPLAQAKAELELGIKKNTANAGLNTCVSAILKSIEEQEKKSVPAPSETNVYDSALNAYNSSSLDEDE